jgi:hypothetical protein
MVKGRARVLARVRIKVNFRFSVGFKARAKSTPGLEQWLGLGVRDCLASTRARVRVRIRIKFRNRIQS